jgi:hypothetical protein
MVLAGVLIYLIMVAQFRSFLDPFIIMFAVPLGIIGVLAILATTGTTLNVQSFMGVIFMIGIAVSVSNSILLATPSGSRIGQVARQFELSLPRRGAIAIEHFVADIPEHPRAKVCPLRIQIEVTKRVRDPRLEHVGDLAPVAQRPPTKCRQSALEWLQVLEESFDFVRGRLRQRYSPVRRCCRLLRRGVRGRSP